MRNRTTNRDLEGVVNRINRAAKTPEAPYTRINDRFKANLGNYHIDSAYGGVRLVQMVNEGGGIKVITEGGFVTKRELYQMLHAFVSGLEAKHDAA